MLKLDILPPKTLNLFEKLAEIGYKFPLIGGTGLSLQIGHRESLDLDFASNDYIKIEDVSIFKKISNKFEIVYQNDEQIDLFVDGVKITLLSYRRKEDFPLLKYKKLQIRDAKDIAISKASTIGRREELKDYIDLYIMLKKNIIKLDELILLSKNRFGGEFSKKLFLKQLLLVKNIENYDIKYIGEKITIYDLYSFFIKLINCELKE